MAIPEHWARALGFLQREAGSFAPGLPFGPDDATSGTEMELQTAVRGSCDDVDLPQIILNSKYYANLLKRSRTKDTPRRAIRDLQRFLDENPGHVWESSWVRFPVRALNRRASEVFRHDLLADKEDPKRGSRSDKDRFFMRDSSGEELVRVPISYLLKLALASALGDMPRAPACVRATGERLMSHFLNDNIAPETFSFHVEPLTSSRGLGRVIAKEAALRYLFTQLLVAYANERFELRQRGQQAMVYLSPHPPVRQKQLNDCVADSFYRELFTSPCLSGWSRGEEKQNYMRLCHEVLSRSQLNAISKVRDAGLIATNLVLLPNLSNVSLANNGIHISLGSRRLQQMMRDVNLGFGAEAEKFAGDLLNKIIEHFLPIFVGTYSAAPYRLDFADFHPERLLGFLPHELDYTHLRMLWRRWKKKAHINVMGYPVTPTGYMWLDRLIKNTFRLRGDFVPDFRLIDYFVALLSTEESPGMDGTLGNSERLKRDLAEEGVFDQRIAFYSLHRMRAFQKMGFSGFESRIYSLFASFSDMRRAVNLQLFLTALAYKYIINGTVRHADIPDDPTTESERRQIFFGSAIGLPTFFVHKQTRSRFLARILAKAENLRDAHRYPDYQRVKQIDYRRALLKTMRADGADLIEAFGLADTLADLEQRVEDPENSSAAGKLMRGILNELNARSALDVRAEDFNRAAEAYYRGTLLKQHLDEAFAFLDEDLCAPPADATARHGCPSPQAACGEPHCSSTPAQNSRAVARSVHASLLLDRSRPDEVLALLQIMLANEHRASCTAASNLEPAHACG